MILLLFLLFLFFVFLFSKLFNGWLIICFDSFLARALPGPFASPVPPVPRPMPAGIQTACRLSLGALIFVAPLALGRPFLLSLPLQTTLQAVLPCCRLGRSNNTPTEFPKSCKKVLQMGIRYDILSVRKRLR